MVQLFSVVHFCFVGLQDYLTVFDAANFEAGIYLIEVLDNRGAVVWHSKAIVQ